jgi:hypothetical protein
MAKNHDKQGKTEMNNDQKTAALRKSNVAACYVKTLADLRAEFEHMAVSSMFGIERSMSGEYIGSRGQTFILWAGYWECAKSNGILIGEDANFFNMHT